MSSSKEAEAISEQIKAMTPPDKLRLAAELLEHREPKLAYAVLDHVKTELGAALALRDLAAIQARQSGPPR